MIERSIKLCVILCATWGHIVLFVFQCFRVQCRAVWSFDLVAPTLHQWTVFVDSILEIDCTYTSANSSFDAVRCSWCSLGDSNHLQFAPMQIGLNWLHQLWLWVLVIAQQDILSFSQIPPIFHDFVVVTSCAPWFCIGSNQWDSNWSKLVLIGLFSLTTSLKPSCCSCHATADV